MPLFNPHELRAQLKSSQTVLGIDPGSRQLGIALSDISLMLASPLITIKRGKMANNAKEINTLCQTHNVGALVVGLPISLDGSFGPAARAASDWTQAIAERLSLPAALWDERLSSSAVNRFLINEADMTRKRRGEVVDKMAASYTLQAWLDATAP
ncbi:MULTISPECIES: Holliday junction resolvase RuvX [unclassified Saccharibacter]|uniref:Holliday junction resolvase RuvX n=1 Tax=unclassified Saccharibacter TaxID=2648722 RepID=UPI00132B4B2B|nr:MULTISPECIES: Holliday junction resolvase RuvX [unclassified Saccharibacter]MXV35885.1 Holliday junction resolvase RuvX [Saccharibacter sp. EH611]MXV58005.1 Holliday junction resolvase RuvX [Saccharibacter sp. EH70]MXV66243.1 Holliday junction resolvase RuvX [Saccharibacter sp. EH60]